MSDFPYGAEPSFPNVRAKVLKQVEGVIAGKAAYQKVSDQAGTQFDKIEIDVRTLRNALHLTPITAPKVDDNVVVEGMGNHVLINALNKRMADGELVPEDLALALKMRQRLHQILDDDLIAEFKKRVERPQFASKAADELGDWYSPKVNAEDLTDEELVEVAAQRVSAFFRGLL